MRAHISSVFCLRELSLVLTLLVVGAGLSACVFDSARIDEYRCDPADPFACAEGVCSPEGFCVSDYEVTLGADVSDANGDAEDDADTAPPPCNDECVAGEICCEGADGSEACVSTRNNEMHCGGCNVQCGQNETCAGTDCTCAVGWSDCDEDPSNGCETDVLTSTEFCGDCGVDGDGSSACRSDSFTCNSGLCLCGDAPCAAGQDCCGTSCIDLTTSPNNCGACGQACEPGETCAGNSCACGTGPACAPNEQCCRGTCIDPEVTQCDCGGAICDLSCCPEAGTEVCVDFTENDAHCGGCGMACEPGRTCENGGCICAAGTLECNGACVNIQTDAANCGDCGRNCTGAANVAGATCAMGMCQIQCAAGFADCDGNPTNGCEVNVASDPLNCGTCAPADTCFDLPATQDVACAMGVCRVDACIDERGNCDGDDSNGCETDTTGDDANCGGCGVACMAGMNTTSTCVDSACEESCVAGYVDCDGLPGCETMGSSCRITDGLIALYTFEEGTGDTTTDQSGFGGALDLVRYNNSSNFEWISGRNGVRFTGDSGMRANDSQSDRIRDECRATDEVTVEAWVKPANASQSGPSRIVTYSYNGSYRNFTLGQQGDRWSVRLRTANSNNNGIKDGNNPIVTNGGSLSADTVAHVVFTYSNGSDDVIFYKNGVEIDRYDNLGGNLNDWSGNHQLAIGNELRTDRIWRGEIYMVAIYDKDLSPAEIMQNYNAGSEP